MAASPLLIFEKNLSHRQIVIKSRTEGWKHAAVVTVRSPRIDFSDLYQRTRRRWARRRILIEAEITGRVGGVVPAKERLDGWE
jgi:hypothetical protein